MLVVLFNVPTGHDAALLQATAGKDEPDGDQNNERNTRHLRSLISGQDEAFILFGWS
jgi:hypothetical protein